MGARLGNRQGFVFSVDGIAGDLYQTVADALNMRFGFLQGSLQLAAARRVLVQLAEQLKHLLQVKTVFATLRNIGARQKNLHLLRQIVVAGGLGKGVDWASSHQRLGGVWRV
jgi:hypothetical protein